MAQRQEVHTASAVDNTVWEKYRRRARGADFAVAADAALAAEAELAAALAEAELAAALAGVSLPSAVNVRDSPRSDSSNPLDVSDLSPTVTGGNVLLQNHWQDKGLHGTQLKDQGELPRMKEQERCEEKYVQAQSEDKAPAKEKPAQYQEQQQSQVRQQQQQWPPQQPQQYKPRARRSMSSSMLAKVSIFEAAAQEQAPPRRPQRCSSVVARDWPARSGGRVPDSERPVLNRRATMGPGETGDRVPSGARPPLTNRRANEPAKALARVPTSQDQAQAARLRAPAAGRDRADRMTIGGSREHNRTPLDQVPGWARPPLNRTPLDRTPGWEKAELNRTPFDRTPDWEKAGLIRTRID